MGLWLSKWWEGKDRTMSWDQKWNCLICLFPITSWVIKTKKGHNRQEKGRVGSNQNTALSIWRKRLRWPLSIFVCWKRRMDYTGSKEHKNMLHSNMLPFYIHVMSSLSSLILSWSTESWLFLADSSAGELWMRWKAHTDIWLIKCHAKMPLKVWYSSLGQRAFSPSSLQLPQRQSERVVSWRRLSRRDMRRTVRVTHKQPNRGQAAARNTVQE